MSIIIFAIVIVSLAAFGAWKDGRDTEGTYEKPKKISSEDRNYNKAKYIVEKYAKALAIEPNGFYRKESLLSHDKATIEEAIFHLANLEGNDDRSLKLI